VEDDLMKKNRDNEIFKSIEKLQRLLEELKDHIERYQKLAIMGILEEDRKE
jgi:hypothetical protein